MDIPNKKNPTVTKAKLVDLIIKCPLAENSENCQFYEKRKLSYSDQLEWLKSLTEEELLKIFLAHCECLADKSTSLNSSS